MAHYVGQISFAVCIFSIGRQPQGGRTGLFEPGFHVLCQWSLAWSELDDDSVGVFAWRCYDASPFLEEGTEQDDAPLAWGEFDISFCVAGMDFFPGGKYDAGCPCFFRFYQFFTGKVQKFQRIIFRKRSFDVCCIGGNHLFSSACKFFPGTVQTGSLEFDGCNYSFDLQRLQFQQDLSVYLF